jgi:hypothetical protein
MVLVLIVISASSTEISPGLPKSVSTVNRVKDILFPDSSSKNIIDLCSDSEDELHQAPPKWQIIVISDDDDDGLETRSINSLPFHF